MPTQKKLNPLKNLKLLFFLLFFPQILIAEPWQFNIKNDYVIPGGLDRFLTNSFDIKSGAYSFHNDMYSPENKKNPEIPYGDRSWDGLSYFEFEDVNKEGFGKEEIIKYRLAAVGEWSGSESLQKFIHDDLGAGQHPTWKGQNPAELAIDVIYSKRTRDYIQSLVGDSMLTQEYGVRFGTVNDSLFLDQELRKHFYKYFYFYGGLRGDAVLYNTHLDGRLFQSNDYTLDKNWFVASGRAGIELYFPEWDDFFINYGYWYITEEFEGQRGRHIYGSLTFGFKF